jgi:hypothetical protein
MSKKWKLIFFQNQMLHYVANIFKRINIKMLKIEIYTSSLYVYLNKLQNQITLHSWIDNRTQKTQQACKLIYAYLLSINYLISCFLIIKKIMLLNVFIYEDAKIQFKCRWFNSLILITTSVLQACFVLIYSRLE